MAISDGITTIECACGAAGYTPIGATPRARAVDGCAYVRAHAAPDGEADLWAQALEACSAVEAFFAGR